MALADFHRLCDLAIDKARLTENNIMLAKGPKTRSGSISNPYSDNPSTGINTNSDQLSYARQWREFPAQKDNDGNSMFAISLVRVIRSKRRFYLTENLPADQRSKGDLWRYSAARRTVNREAIEMIQSTSQSRENLSGGDENMLPLRCRIH
jgi:hypothetical protein